MKNVRRHKDAKSTGAPAGKGSFSESSFHGLVKFCTKKGVTPGNTQQNTQQGTLETGRGRGGKWTPVGSQVS